MKDSHCPGIISEEEATFEVDFKPRPAVQLLETSSAVREGDAYRHKGLCAGEEDQVALRFNGLLVSPLDSADSPRSIAVRARIPLYCGWAYEQAHSEECPRDWNPPPRH